LREGKYDEAKADFDELLRLCPTLPAAYSSRGDALMHKGELERAEQDYREAIELDPGSAEAYAVHRLLVEASYHRERAQFREAIKCAGEALERDEECGPALEIRAGAYWYSEHLVEAVDDYTRLIELDGESVGAYNGRGHALAEMGEFAQALADLDKALELAEPLQDPTMAAYARNGRALALAGLERFEDADRDFQQSLQACPENGWAHYNRGLMLQRQGCLDEALAAFRKALDSQKPALSPRKSRRARAFVQAHQDSDKA
jgi:tetratricopeptide (TPR) repeat protein